jgi:hypothetical protein
MVHPPFPLVRVPLEPEVPCPFVQPTLPPLVTQEVW